jgi:hypothetical protein
MVVATQGDCRTAIRPADVSDVGGHRTCGQRDGCEKRDDRCFTSPCVHASPVYLGAASRPCAAALAGLVQGALYRDPSGVFNVRHYLLASKPKSSCIGCRWTGRLLNRSCDTLMGMLFE